MREKRGYPAIWIMKAGQAWRGRAWQSMASVPGAGAWLAAAAVVLVLKLSRVQQLGVKPAPLLGTSGFWASLHPNGSSTIPPLSCTIPKQHQTAGLPEPALADRVSPTTG